MYCSYFLFIFFSSNCIKQAAFSQANNFSIFFGAVQHAQTKRESILVLSKSGLIHWITIRVQNIVVSLIQLGIFYSFFVSYWYAPTFRFYNDLNEFSYSYNSIWFKFGFKNFKLYLNLKYVLYKLSINTILKYALVDLPI